MIGKFCLKILLLLLLLSFLTPSFSLAEDPKPLTFKERKELANILKKADLLYSEKSVENIEDIISLYSEAFHLDPDNAEVCYRLGELNYELNSDNRFSEIYFQRALRIQPMGLQKIFYYLGICAHRNYDFETAKNYFLQQLDLVDNLEEEREIYFRIQQTETALHLKKNPVRCIIRNLGKNVNSEHAEYAPLVTADGLTLLFTSRRGALGDPVTTQGDYFEQLYITSRDSLYGEWKPIQRPNLEQQGTHTAAVGFSNDGQRVMIYRSLGGGDLYEAKLVGSNFTLPERMSDSINTDFHENTGSYAFDGKTIYFTSNKLGGMGKHDIYKTTRMNDTTWSSPENLGNVINTPGDEISVFAHPDGKTLYFSSDGHMGMGGFDIFKTVFENGEWSIPENLGFPINTVGDDLFFTITADNRQGFYSAIRPGGMGKMDIYSIIFTGKQKPMFHSTHDVFMASSDTPSRTYKWRDAVEKPTSQLVLFKGIIRDLDTQTPLSAEITIFDNVRDSLVATLHSNAETGKFLVVLPVGRNYGLFIKHSTYLYYSTNFDLLPTEGFSEIYREIYLSSIKSGETLRLNNLFFDTNQFELRAESMPELKNMKQLLLDNPTMQIEISGHTDNVGRDSYNQTLSEKRTQSVIQWLKKEGISSERIIAKGYGSSRPLNDNSTEEFRQQNRRIELTIVEL